MLGRVAYFDDEAETARALGNLVSYCAALAVRLGYAASGVRLGGAVAALTDLVRVAPIPIASSILRPALEEARQVLGEAQFDAEWQAGRQMSLDEAVAEALTIEIPGTRKR